MLQPRWERVSQRVKADRDFQRSTRADCFVKLARMYGEDAALDPLETWEEMGFDFDQDWQILMASLGLIEVEMVDAYGLRNENASATAFPVTGFES